MHPNIDDITLRCKYYLITINYNVYTLSLLNIVQLYLCLVTIFPSDHSIIPTTEILHFLVSFPVIYIEVVGAGDMYAIRTIDCLHVKRN